MRPGLYAIALALSACSFAPGKGSGDAQDTPKDAPIVIDTSMIDTPMIDGAVDAMIDAAPIDTDGDTVVDSMDNCPLIANLNQRNHDGDVHGDVCDKCPHLPSATDPDADNDGVGDDCDPRPVTAGDSIAFFEGFYDTNAIASWTINGGTWAVANGVLRQSGTSTTDVQLVAPMTIARAAVTSSAHVNAFGNNSGGFTAPHVSVSTGVATGQWYWCSVVDDPQAGDRIYATTDWNGATTNYPSASWPGTFAAGSDVRMTSALIGGNNVCTVVQGVTTASAMGAHGPTSGKVQVATRSADATFDYVFAVSIGP